jgi:hypothetical protein
MFSLCYNAPMLTFRLKYLFCLILVIGVALMWWTWANGKCETANRLLEVRENLRDWQNHAEKNGPMKLGPSNTEVRSYISSFLQEAGVPKPQSSPCTAPEYGYGASTGGDTSMASHSEFELWFRSELTVDYKIRWYHRKHVGTEVIVVWTADWPAIEAKAAEENWTYYRQVIVTVLAVLTLGWVVLPRRK